jgi:ribosomal protein L35
MKKNKMKIKKSVSSRFKVTKTGKVLFSHQYASHKKANKSGSRKRRQQEPGELKGKFAKKVKKMLGKQ